jgi:hypothetical protein
MVLLLRVKKKFKPFRVTISPKLENLLEEIDIDWEKYSKKIDELISKEQYNIFRDGMIFTVLNPDWEYGLVFSDSEKNIIVKLISSVSE